MTEQLDIPYCVDWIKVPHSSFIMKFNFEDDYNVLISNFVCVYAEKLKGPEAVKRFNENNPRVEINSAVLFKHLKKAIECSIEKKEGLVLEQRGNKLFLQLQFEVMQAFCHYEIIMNILPQEEMLNLIIAPLMFNSCLNYLSCFGSKRKSQGTKDRTSNDVIHSVNSISSSGSSMIPPICNNSEAEIRIKNFESSLMSGNKVPFSDLVEAFIDIQHQQKHLLPENFECFKQIRLETPVPEDFSQTLPTLLCSSDEVKASETSTSTSNVVESSTSTSDLEETDNSRRPSGSCFEATIVIQTESRRNEAKSRNADHEPPPPKKPKKKFKCFRL